MDAIAKLLKLLGHPDRLRILALLRRGELAVSELVTVLNLSQPRITQYIGSLEEIGLVDRLREGAWVFSRLRSDHPGSTLVKTVLDTMPKDDPTLTEDLERLQTVRAERATQAEVFFADVANDRGQLSHEFLPQTKIEAAMIDALGDDKFNFMVDLGTGTGRILELFATRVKQGSGIDLSPEMLRVARHKLAGQAFAHLFVQQSDINETPLANDVADLVTIHQVLHHLDDPQGAVREAARLLAPEGRLIVVDFEAHEVEEFRKNYAHRRLGFEPSEVETLLQDNGLSNIQIKTVPSDADAVPNVLIWTATA